MHDPMYKLAVQTHEAFLAAIAAGNKDQVKELGQMMNVIFEQNPDVAELWADSAHEAYP
jgi:DNA-binding GntR family transcriptional regulator